MSYQNIAPDVKLGKDVKIYDFVNLYGCEIGDNSKVGTFVEIQKNAKIGKNCKVEGMAYIPPLTVIGDGVFLGPGVIFTNDPYPMSDRMVGVTVKDDAIVCAGAMLKAWETTAVQCRLPFWD